jgi:hypothetical protein
MPLVSDITSIKNLVNNTIRSLGSLLEALEFYRSKKSTEPNVTITTQIDGMKSTIASFDDYMIRAYKLIIDQMDTDIGPTGVL